MYLALIAISLQCSEDPFGLVMSVDVNRANLSRAEKSYSAVVSAFYSFKLNDDFPWF